MNVSRWNSTLIFPQANTRTSCVGAEKSRWWFLKALGAPEELVSQSAQDRLADLLSFQQTDFESPSREGLLRAIERAANLKFDWGLSLADALAASSHWDTDIWRSLMRAWSCELNESKHTGVLSRLIRPELYPKHTRQSADMLHVLVRKGGVPYAAALLPQANKLAMNLWNQIAPNENLIERNDWLTTSINQSAGVLALFWIESLSVWRNWQEPTPKNISDEYRKAISTIIQDSTLAGRFGRTVLAWSFSLLISYDSDWIKDKFLPLFQQHKDADYQALWDGLTAGRLTPGAAEILSDAVLNALPHIETVFSGEERLRSFIGTYTAMLIYIVNDPLAEWIPKFFKYADSDSRSYFASQIGHFLDDVDDAKQRELWTRWLHRYWENRLQGVPVQLIDEEIAEMIVWAPRFNSLFPDAVGLATKMPSNDGITARHIWTALHRIQARNIWRSHPESTASFLLHLKPLFLSYHSPDKIRELIDNLRKMNLPPETDRDLDELSIELP